MKGGGRQGAGKMKMSKELKNKTDEEEVDNDKEGGDRWGRACPPTCIEFWAVDSTDHWI